MNDYTTYTPVPQVNPAVQAARNTGGSAVFLIAAILYTLSAVLSLVNTFTSSSVLTSMLYTMSMYDSDIYEIISIIRPVTIIAGLLAFIPTLLACIGFWVYFGACKNQRSYTVSTTGMSLVQATTIIRLVFLSLALLLFAILMIPLSIGLSELMSYSDYYYYTGVSSNALIICIAVFVLLLAVMILYIVYYAKVLGTISAVKTASRGNFPIKHGSMYVVVLNFIAAVFSLVNIFLNFASGSIIGALISILNAAWLVMISISILQFRSQIQQAIQSYTANTASMPRVDPQPMPVSQDTAWNQPQEGTWDTWHQTPGNSDPWAQPQDSSQPAQNQSNQNQQPGPWDTNP